MSENQIRDHSLITVGGGGGVQNGRGGGGQVKFYPYKKEGAQQVLAMLKVEHKRF